MKKEEGVLSKTYLWTLLLFALYHFSFVKKAFRKTTTYNSSLVKWIIL